MNNVLKYISYTCFIACFILLPLTVGAYEYDAEEGRFVGRAKVGVAIVDSSEKESISGVPVDRINPGSKFFDSSASIEVEGDYFVFDHFSLGASLGYLPEQASTWTVASTPPRSESGKITAIPISANAKLHIAPYGEIRPYILGGYHYTYFASSYDSFSFKNDSGPVAGIGTDWWMNKNLGLNLEIKQYFMETEINISGLTRAANDIIKAEINPLIFSAGFVYRF